MPRCITTVSNLTYYVNLLFQVWSIMLICCWSLDLFCWFVWLILLICCWKFVDLIYYVVLLLSIILIFCCKFDQLLWFVVVILWGKFELLITEPENNVPRHKSHTTCSEPAVERLHPFPLCSLSGTVQHTRVFAFWTVHEPRK